ncbi:MAG: chromate transporter [Clostridia bacterium]|nr:chromate transporter [Clostridia bacterium]
MEKLKKLLGLFLTMFKIGLFTFGGGYAMIALLENEFVEKKKLLEHEEFLDMVAIAESTPGPIAINSATYIGYKTDKVIGSIVSTIAVCLPSFIIIYLISLFFDAFLAIELVAHAFKGIQVGVTFLILFAGIKMMRAVKKDALSIILLCFGFLATIAISLFDLNISTIFIILAGGLVGLVAYLVSYVASRSKKATESETVAVNEQVEETSEEEER